MAIEFRHLEVFCEVVRLKSFGRAAQKVGLSQASVSERVASLEESVGSQLLDRSRRRGVEPTTVGRALYRHAVRLLDQRELLLQEMGDLLNLQSGTLTIGASTLPATYYVPPLIKKFRSVSPDVVLSVATAGSEKVVDWVAEGVVELGIAGDPGGQLIGPLLQGHHSSLRIEAELWEDQFVLAVPTDHPWSRRDHIALEELQEASFVMREPQSGTRRWLEAYLRDEIPGGVDALQTVAEFGSLGAVKQAVIHGVGVSLMSSRAAEAEAKAGLLRTLEVRGASFRRRFYLVLDQQRTRSPLCRAFVELLLDELGVPGEPQSAGS